MKLGKKLAIGFLGVASVYGVANFDSYRLGLQTAGAAEIGSHLQDYQKPSTLAEFRQRAAFFRDNGLNAPERFVTKVAPIGYRMGVAVRYN